jgi:hypothetical protein
MSERQATTGQLRLIRDLHVDRKLATLSAEQAAPILSHASLLNAERLQAAPGIRRDESGVLLGNGRQLAFGLSRTEGVSRDFMTGVYSRLADRLNIDFAAPATYEQADRQIARLKSIVRGQTQAGTEASHDLEADDSTAIAELQRDPDEAERHRASYAPDTTENLPSTPESERAGTTASWGAGHQMAQQHVSGRASAKQVQLLGNLAAMAGIEVTAAETTQDVGRQIDTIVESTISQIHEIQTFLQVEQTATDEMKPWNLGHLLQDTKVAAMNELRTLEQMKGVTELAKPTSWPEARDRIGKLRETQNLGGHSLYSFRTQTAVPFFGDPSVAKLDNAGERPDTPVGPQRNAMSYAGIGSRRTPGPALNAMRATAERLSTLGYTMRSGHAPGADTAFEVASQNSEIYLPWSSFENERPVIGSRVQPQPTAAAMQLASRIHPAWERLDRGPRARHARNMHQILGADLDSPVDFVVCYTPDGSLTGHGPDTGGTATALRLAYRNNIPVINIKRPEHAAMLASYLQENVPERRLQHCRGWLDHHLPASDQQLAELLDLQVDERLSRMLPSQALAAITATPLHEVADATADFPFQYDEHGHQTGTGVDLMRWYAQQPGADVASGAAYDQLADHWGLSVTAADNAELAQIKIVQMRESLWGVTALDSMTDVGAGLGIGG